MKKLLAIILLVVLALSLTSCTEDDISDNLSQKEQERLQEELEKRGYDISSLFPNESNDTQTPSTDSTPMEQTKLGDIIEFGSINWIVLSVEDDKMLILSEEVLEKKSWHHENAPVTWEECDIRAYLNSSFYDATFNDQEKKRILDSELENKSNPNNIFGTQGGPNTIDRVFLLSSEEVYKYMGDNAHVKLRTARVAKYIVTGEAVYWQLRSHGKGYHKDGCGHYEGSPCHPEENYHSIATVNKDGIIHSDSIGLSNHYSDEGYIRPAMWIKL